MGVVEAAVKDEPGGLGLDVLVDDVDGLVCALHRVGWQSPRATLSATSEV